MWFLMILLTITNLHFIDHGEDDDDDADIDNIFNDDLLFLDHQSSLTEAEATPRSFA